MKTLEELFIVHRAKSRILSEYEPGPVPYISNSFSNNAVEAYVSPLPDDRVFDCRAIVVSAFGETTIQMPPFIAYGAAGTSLTVLEPRIPITNAHLAYYAAWLSNSMKGRFNWYFRSITSRIKRFTVPDSAPDGLKFKVKSLIPQQYDRLPLHERNFQLTPFLVTDLFDVHRARSTGYDRHESGNVAFVSNGEGVGIVGYVAPLPGEKIFSEPAITISAMSGAQVHAPKFIARGSGGSGLVVLTPKASMSVEQLFCAAADYNHSINWRFHWYRQITADHVRRISLHIPATNGVPDEKVAIRFVESSVPYWWLLKKYLTGAFDTSPQAI